MRFVYLIAAYNEEKILADLVVRLEGMVSRFPGSVVFLCDNGSSDGSWLLMQKFASERPSWLFAFHERRKGMGVAFRRGLAETARLSLGKDDWVVLTAADLPFGFSDVESLIGLTPPEREQSGLLIGSKAHPASVVKRDTKRRLGSSVFWILRRLILGLKTVDTQGTILIRGDLLPGYRDFLADDFFYTIELIDRAERAGIARELPIILEAELRPSRVNLMVDGWRMIVQLVRYRWRR